MAKFNHRRRREVLAGEEWMFNKGAELWPDDTSTDRERIAEAIERLEDPYRSVVSMRFYGRLTFREISKEMGWKDRRWAAVYLRRGLTRLRRFLEESPPQDG